LGGSVQADAHCSADRHQRQASRGSRRVVTRGASAPLF
jgi:hypothetical protein